MEEWSGGFMAGRGLLKEDMMDWHRWKNLTRKEFGRGQIQIEKNASNSNTSILM